MEKIAQDLQNSLKISTNKVSIKAFDQEISVLEDKITRINETKKSIASSID